MSNPENAAENKASSLSIRITFDGNLVKSLLCALFGAATIIVIFQAMQYIGGMVAGIMPFFLGTLLFATLAGGFFCLLQTQKIMRQNAGMRISFGDAYTGLSIFIVMGLFAMACMHVFQGDGLALAFWTKGVVAAGASAVGFGLGKFFVTTYKEGAAKR